MPPKNLKDRRKYIRAKRVLSIQHRLYRRKSEIIEGPWHFSLTENMSVGGLLFVSHALYRVGDILELKVVMSGALDIFIGFARVIRVSCARNKKNSYIAVRYATDEKRRRRIKRHSASSSSK